MSIKNKLQMKSTLTALSMLLLLNCNTARAEGWIDIGAATAINTRLEAGNFSAYGLRYNHIKNNFVYSVGYREGIEFSFFNDNEFKELSAGLGRYYANRFGATTIQTGFGVRNYEDNNTESSRFFFPLSGTLILGKYVGISQSLNLNVSRNPTIGYVFSYSFGKFK